MCNACKKRKKKSLINSWPIKKWIALYITSFVYGISAMVYLQIKDSKKAISNSLHYHIWLISTEFFNHTKSLTEKVSVWASFTNTKAWRAKRSVLSDAWWAGTGGVLLTCTTNELLPSATATTSPFTSTPECLTWICLPHKCTYTCVSCVCVCRKCGVTCPNGGPSITLVRKDSKKQGGAKAEGTTGRKGSDVNESSNLSCHVRSKAKLSLSSVCVRVCVCVGNQCCHVW